MDYALIFVTGFVLGLLTIASFVVSDEKRAVALGQITIRGIAYKLTPLMEKIS